MARPTTTFFDELVAAARGCLALVVGNRGASSFFDFRQPGLVGSFIAILVGMALQAFAPQFLTPDAATGFATGAIVMGLILVAVQYGVGYLVLRQLGRGDGFIPFVVVQNWVTLFQSILVVAIIAAFGEPMAFDAATEMVQPTAGSVPFLLLGIAALVVSVNIGRLILTLQPLQVALFVGTQLGTAFLVQPILGMMV